MSDYEVGDKIRLSYTGKVEEIDGALTFLEGFGWLHTALNAKNVTVEVVEKRRPKVGDKVSKDGMFFTTAPSAAVVRHIFPGCGYYVNTGRDWYGPNGNGPFKRSDFFPFTNYEIVFLPEES
jgi:hypothetical protein